MFTRAVIEQLMRPLHCRQYGNDDTTTTSNNNTTTTTWMQDMCHVIAHNGTGEYDYFHDGMSFGDLIHDMVTKPEYRKVHQWTGSGGFCMHSDWVWGYLVGSYNLSERDPDIWDRLQYEERLIAYRGAELSYDKRLPLRRKRKQKCWIVGKYCNTKSHICHYVTPALFGRLDKALRG